MRPNVSLRNIMAGSTEKGNLHLETRGGCDPKAARGFKSGRKLYCFPKRVDATTSLQRLPSKLEVCKLFGLQVLKQLLESRTTGFNGAMLRSAKGRASYDLKNAMSICILRFSQLLKESMTRYLQ